MDKIDLSSNLIKVTRDHSGGSVSHKILRGSDGNIDLVGVDFLSDIIKRDLRTNGKFSKISNLSLSHIRNVHWG
jgi:hypothetical protein